MSGSVSNSTLNSGIHGSNITPTVSGNKGQMNHQIDSGINQQLRTSTSLQNQSLGYNNSSNSGVSSNYNTNSNTDLENLKKKKKEELALIESKLKKDNYI